VDVKFYIYTHIRNPQILREYPLIYIHRWITYIHVSTEYTQSTVDFYFLPVLKM